MLKKNNVTGIVNIWEKESFNSISGPLKTPVLFVPQSIQMSTRLQITPSLPHGETRATYTACDVFNVTRNAREEPLRITKRILLAFTDLPMSKAAKLLGFQRATVCNMRCKFGMHSWPYQSVMRGLTSAMTKAEIVELRQKLIAELEAEAQTQQVSFLLQTLRAVADEAEFFWKVYGQGWLESKVQAPVKRDKKAKKGKKSKAVRAGDVKKTATKEELAKQAESDEPAPEPMHAIVVTVNDLGSVDTAAVNAVLKKLRPGPREVLAEEVEVMPTFWPVITEQINFDPLFCSEMEDVLQLGPVAGV